MRDQEDSDSGEETEKDQDEKEVERPAKSKSKRSASKAPAPKSGASGSSRIALAAVVALAVGGAVGWFGHQAQARSKLHAASAPATVSSSGKVSGPCGTWQDKICEGGGEESSACQEAKGAVDLLTSPVCEVALEAVPATLAKVKAARASCDSLVTKICGDLPQGSTTCDMVKQRTPSFPPKHCDEMLKNYDKVISQLKQLDAQGGPQLGVPGGPGPQMGGPGGPGPQMGGGPRMMGRRAPPAAP